MNHLMKQKMTVDEPKDETKDEKQTLLNSDNERLK